MKATDEDNEEKLSNAETPFPSVSANTLARCLGVPPKVIYDLAKAGIIERGPGRLFKLEDSVRRYCEHLPRQTITWPSSWRPCRKRTTKRANPSRSSTAGRPAATQ